MAEGHMKYDVMKLSEYIIRYYNDRDKIITCIRLQEVLYYVQAWFLMQTDDVCFIDNIEAKEVGPIIAPVNAKYKEYGANNIPVPKDYAEMSMLPTDFRLLTEVIEYTFSWSNSAMTNLVHDQRPYRHALKTHSRIILPEKMKSYFG